MILIVCDTLRADRLGCYGSERAATPRLDALAAGGVRFANAYSQSSKTMPSMAALMSGRPVDEIGVGRGNRFHLAERVETLAERISTAGHPTAAVVSNPVLRLSNVRDIETRGIAQGFDVYDDAMSKNERAPDVIERTGPETTAAALRWVDESCGSGRDDFFLWVHYIDPHGPYTAPAPWLNATKASNAEFEHAADLPVGRFGSGHRELPLYQVIDDERSPKVYVERYEAEVAFVDDAIGQLIDGLASRGLLDDALVVFTSDHGESLGEQDWWFSHGYTLHASNIHIPLILRMPSGHGTPAGSVVETTVQHLDVASTILDAFGLRADDDPRLSFLRGLPAGDGVAIQQMGELGKGRRAWGVTSGRWQLVTNGRRAGELYDLSGELGRDVNLARKSPEVVQELARLYGATIDRVGLPAIPGVADLPGTTQRNENLKAFGYGGGE